MSMKFRVKKIFISLVLFISCLSLCSCSNDYILDDNDMIIVDKNNIYGVNLEQEELIINSTKKKREKADCGLWYYNNLFFENETAYFTKTSTDKNLNVWIEKIDKSNFNITRKKHTSIDTNCALLTDDYYYVVNNFVKNLKIDVYDLNLKLVKTIDFSYDGNSSIYPTDLIEVNGSIYMLCGIIPANSEFGYTENYIFKLNTQFDVVEKYDLYENQGSFFSFVYANNKLYLTHTTNKINDERMALGSNEIYIFDLKEEKVLEEKITLNTTFPFDIYYDEHNNNLIVSHGENGPSSNHIWTIYDLDTSSEAIIPVDFSEFKEGVPIRSAFFASGVSKYYLLFPDCLCIYDIEGKTSVTYKLDEYGIDNAVLIVLNE